MERNSPPFNLQPLGVLDAFGIKNGGRYPQYLQDTVDPNMDLLQWYSETNGEDYELVLAAVGVGAINTNPMSWTSSLPANLPVNGAGFVTVPDSQIWHVTDYGLVWRWTAAATGSGYLPTLGVRTPGPALSAVGAFRPLPTLVAGAGAASAAMQNGGAAAMVGPTFLKPGEQLGFWFGGGSVDAAGTLTYTGHVRLRRYRI